MTQIETKIVKSNIQNQLDGDFVAPIVLMGSPGTGKTSSVKAIGKSMNCPIVNISMASLTIEELGGIPTFISAPEMDKYSTVNSTNSESTQWSVPEIIKTANIMAEDTQNDGIIILCDDIHETNMSVKPALYEFLLERKLGQYKLHDKVAIVATMNDSDEANYDGFSSAIINRLAMLKLEPSFENWYKKHGANYNMFVSSFLKVYSSFTNEQEDTRSPFGTGRSFHMLSETIEPFDDDFIVENSFKLARQYISEEASRAFTEHVNYITKIDFTGLIKSRKIIDIGSMDFVDQIMHGNIVNYVETVEDAQYLAKLLDANLNVNTFLGFSSGQIYSKFLLMDKGKKITKGQEAIVYKIMSISPKGFTKKELDQYDRIVFENQSAIMAVASDYCN